MKKSIAIKKAKANPEKIMVIGIIVVLVVGLGLIALDVGRTVGYDKERESKVLKEQILINLDAAEKKLEEVSKMIDASSSD